MSGGRHGKMVKFGRPRGKLEDERRREFLRKSVGGREGRWRRQGYEKRRRATREVLREGHGWTEESSGRENRRETRDKETNIDNEKTSMAKKEVRRRSERMRDRERSIVGVRIRIPTAMREKI